MTIPVHRDTDPRVCGAITVVANQNTVYANGLLVAVDGDPNSHSAGGLIATCNNVPDTLCFIIGPTHCAPATAGGSPNVFVGD